MLPFFFDVSKQWIWLVGLETSVADPDPDPHGQMRIRIQEVKKPRKCTGSLGEYRSRRIKVRILL